MARIKKEKEAEREKARLEKEQEKERLRLEKEKQKELVTYLVIQLTCRRKLKRDENNKKRSRKMFRRNLGLLRFVILSMMLIYCRNNLNLLLSKRSTTSLKHLLWKKVYYFVTPLIVAGDSHPSLEISSEEPKKKANAPRERPIPPRTDPEEFRKTLESQDTSLEELRMELLSKKPYTCPDIAEVQAKRTERRKRKFSEVEWESGIIFVGIVLTVKFRLTCSRVKWSFWCGLTRRMKKRS